ncbi:unnamed protein product [marine sediment metagenome]|uniref:Uncharacterized protein n=1 Tax=marine sediment metagenome TaxID=412755 RepID=X0WIS1_9ZZZZ
MPTDADEQLWAARKMMGIPKTKHGKYCFPPGGFWVYGAECKYIVITQRTGMGFFRKATCLKNHELLKNIEGQTNVVHRPKKCDDYEISDCRLKDMTYFGINVDKKGKNYGL